MPYQMIFNPFQLNWPFGLTMQVWYRLYMNNVQERVTDNGGGRKSLSPKHFQQQTLRQSKRV